MNKIWTPIHLPPAPELTTDLSDSAIKIILFLQHQHQQCGIYPEYRERQILDPFREASKSSDENQLSYSHYFSKQYTELPKIEEEWRKDLEVELENIKLQYYKTQVNFPVVVSPYFPNKENFPIQCRKVNLKPKEPLKGIIDSSNTVSKDFALPKNCFNQPFKMREKIEVAGSKRKLPLQLDCSFQKIFVESKISDYFPKLKQKNMNDNTSNESKDLLREKNSTYPKLEVKRLQINKKELNKKSICKVPSVSKIKSMFQFIKSYPTFPEYQLGLALKDDPKHTKVLKQAGTISEICENKENIDIIKNTSSPFTGEKITDISKENIVTVDEDDLKNLKQQISQHGVTEIGFTITYRNGESLLDRDESEGYTSPNGIVIKLELKKDCSHYLFLGLKILEKDFSRTFLLELLNYKCRKICSKAQIFISFILDTLKIDSRQISNWCILDPMVALWLLDPDHPPKTFTKIAANLKFLKKSVNEDWKSKCCKLLSIQSKILERLYTYLLSQDLWDLFIHMETKVTPILAGMENWSIRIDRNEMSRLGRILQNKLKELEKAAWSVSGLQFQLNSPSQLRDILYNQLQLDKKNSITIAETDKLGVKSTAEPALKILSKIHPLPQIILDYRHLHKLKSTYIDGLLEYIRNTGFVSSSWEQCSASTGRITSSKPNLQTIPKQMQQMAGLIEGINMRSSFVSRQGHQFVAIDFEHIELRVFAHLSKDDRLLKMFKEKIDIFTNITQLRLGIKEITSIERDKTKTLVYSLLYGAGIEKVANLLTVDKFVASTICKQFHDLLPSLIKFRKTILGKCRQFKQLTSISGRRRLFPNIDSPEIKMRYYIERQAVNFVIQGSAADICKVAMINAENVFREKKINARLLLQIHDELVWEVAEEQIEEAKGIY